MKRFLIGSVTISLFFVLVTEFRRNDRHGKFLSGTLPPEGW